MQRKRILYISGQDMMACGAGSEVWSWHFAKQLSVRNDVTALNATLSDNLTGDLQVGGLRVRSHKIRSRYTKVLMPALLREGCRLLKASKYDLIVCSYVWSGSCGWLLSRMFGLPYAFCDHNVEHVLKRKTDSFPEFLYGALIERLCCATAGLVVTLSEEDRLRLSPWIRHRSMASSFGVDLEVLNPFYEPAVNVPPTVLFFGHLGTVPNIEAVHAIYETIAPAVLSQVTCRFKIAGQGGPIPLESPGVEQVGFVADIAACIKTSDLVIVPLKTGGGVRSKIIESLACGKTVISTFKGAEGIPDRFQNLIICELEQFAPAIVEALRTRLNVSQADYDLIAAKYSWESLALAFEKAIADMLHADDRC